MRHRQPVYQPHRLSWTVVMDAQLPTTQLKRAIDMTDDELSAIVAKARLTVIK